jgi:UDP-2,3-diacylglucosamine pyrophosphatase LpxH
VLLLTEAFLNAESTVDQTTMIQVLKLMSDAQDHHIRDLHSIRSVQNSLSAETQIPVMYGENLMMVHGDHLLLTTSGITTMVLLLYAET